MWEENFKWYPAEKGFSPALIYMPQFVTELDFAEEVQGRIPQPVTFYSLEENSLKSELTKSIDRFPRYYAR